MTQDYAARLQARIEQQKKLRRKNAVGTFVAYSIVTLAVLALLAALFIVGGLITMFAWNVGVVAIVAAAGGSVGKIGLLTAIAANFAIGIVGRIFRPQQVATKS